jgi:hypothetical protein
MLTFPESPRPARAASVADALGHAVRNMVGTLRRVRGQLCEVVLDVVKAWEAFGADFDVVASEAYRERESCYYPTPR